MIITITFDELENKGYESVTDYCRELMDLNAERYQDASVEVYRGTMLCLTVRKVSEAAKLVPMISEWGRHRPKEDKYCNKRLPRYRREV